MWNATFTASSWRQEQHGTMSIKTRYQRIRAEVPEHVQVVVAVKARTPEEIAEVIAAGATNLGENYVQEAETHRAALGHEADIVRWHMIGHLQTNKINKALRVFDVVQTVDSLESARAIERRVGRAGRGIVPCYIEVNIGNEDTKAGIRPEEHEPFDQFMVQLVTEMAKLRHVRIEGLMTMGPRFGDAETPRLYFRKIKRVFDMLRALATPAVAMEHLSMGMTNSYRVAIEEGANMVRIGSGVFGARTS